MKQTADHARPQGSRAGARPGLAGLALAALLLATITPGPARGADTSRSETGPVVMELFTSQGCEACPAMDRLLGEFVGREDVIALSFHVDYWNYIGWRDPYSKPSFSKRQKLYARRFGDKMVSTPQFVVDGEYEADATSKNALERLVEMAREAKPDRARVSLEIGASGELRVAISGPPQAEPAHIWMVTFDQLRGTAIRSGENQGMFLRNYNVVRNLVHVGLWPGGDLEMRLDGSTLMVDHAGGCAILVQGEHMGPFLGAAKLTWN